MATSVSRILQLLELLQSAGLRTVSELSTRLDVDERTVRRYVEQMRDLQIPVESVRGRRGGYRIAPGYRMPPLMLTDDEAVAVLVSLFRMQPADATSSTAVQTALSKVRRALPTGAARRVDALLATAAFDPTGPSGSPDADILLTFADAVAHRRPVEFTYRRVDADAPATRRTLHPYDLTEHAGHWYISGLDSTSAQERTFRIDRVRMARALPGTFSSRPYRGDASSDTPLDLPDRFARAERRWRVVLHINADEEHIRRHLPTSIAVLQSISSPDDARWYSAEITAERLDWIPAVIVALGCPVVIEAPDELRDVANTAARRLLSAASPASTTPCG